MTYNRPKSRIFMHFQTLSYISGRRCNRMTGIKKRGPYYKAYSPENLDNAIRAVLNGEMRQSLASSVFGVPQTSIFNRLAAIRRNKEFGH